MTPRWLVRLALISTLSLAAAPALAQEGKVKKAEKMLAKYGGTDHVKLAKAWDAINTARTHEKSRDLPWTWVVLAEIDKAYLLDPEAEAPTGDPAAAAIEAYDTAIGKDPDKAFAERILEGVATIEGMERGKATEAYEAKLYEEAWPHLQNAIHAQKLIRQVGRLDLARESLTLKLAVLTAVKRNDLDGARKLHVQLLADHHAPTGTSLSLASAIAEEEGHEAALAFLAPLVEDDPDNAALLEARFEHMFALEQNEAIIQLLESYAESVGKALEITLLHASTWDRIGDLGHSAEAYARAMELGPTDQRVLRGYGDLELRRAIAFDQAAKATRKWRERKQHRKDRDEARQRAIQLFQASQDLDSEHLPTLELLLDLYKTVRWDDREEVQALEAKIDELRNEEAPAE